MYYTQKKIEAYINYILQGNAVEYFNLSIDDHYFYVIEFIAEKMRVSKSYSAFLQELADQMNQDFGGTITLNLANFK